MDQYTHLAAKAKRLSKQLLTACSRALRRRRFLGRLAYHDLAIRIKYRSNRAFDIRPVGRRLESSASDLKYGAQQLTIEHRRNEYRTRTFKRASIDGIPVPLLAHMRLQHTVVRAETLTAMAALERGR